MSSSADDLITRHIELDPEAPGPMGARLAGAGVRVWAACPARTESEFSTVALNDPTAGGPLPKGESTAKVVRGIVRGLDSRKAFVFPTWTAWTTVAVSKWLPGPFEWAMERYSASAIRREIRRAKGGPRS